MSLIRLRERLPSVVFVLLLILGLVFLGFACACSGGHHGQAADSVTSVIASAPPLIELWSLTAFGLIVISALALGRRAVRGPSLASLQRLLL